VRVLDPVEIRIIGALLEKQQTTPEYYPLTLNALVDACNQKTNREPVMSLEVEEVSRATAKLRADAFLWEVRGGRVVRWDHNVDGQWELERDTKALITLLLLRGPQTPGELRSRSERLYRFETVGDVEASLLKMVDRPFPIVRELARRGGQKESRWMHLLGGEPVDEPEAAVELRPAAGTMVARVERLEQEIAELREEMRLLKERLGE
jgi:uncharacterized protein